MWVCFRSANSYFELEWRDGRVCIRAANGKYVTAKKNGQLAATIDSAGQPCSLHSQIQRFHQKKSFDAHINILNVICVKKRCYGSALMVPAQMFELPVPRPLMPPYTRVRCFYETSHRVVWSNLNLFSLQGRPNSSWWSSSTVQSSSSAGSTGSSGLEKLERQP